MIEVHLCGIGLLGPGLAGYNEDSRELLAGRRLHRCEPTPDPVPPLLPPNERRRASALVRHALAVAEEAIQGAEVDPGTLATVFASSGGEYAILDRMCAALASPDRALSPTLFHHSVHNAAAGYFAIATGSRRSSTALAAYDATFAAGLIEAAGQVAAEPHPVLFVAYDLPPPEPLYPARPLSAPFALALVLLKQRTAALARLQVDLCGRDTPVTRLPDPSLDSLRRGNPAARGLPLLAALARGAAERVVFEYLEDRHLAVRISP
ncbi:MAG: beta-ketoacyl synthase chain length factor [Gammaproteobacteria bacterium]|nr:beta-ketoacyl synthase chain length factor [Gammaproteobacteria bacterium]